MKLDSFQHCYRQRIDTLLTAEIAALPHLAPRLRAAMQHGLLLGGKRVRPFLVYAVGTMLGAKPEQLDPAAAAIEMIHAYSLIHDDLPAMDDDDLRRGQPTVHKAFDEATAILAGDALQTLAFTLLSRPSDLPQPLAMVQKLAQASGYQGMCGGQALDMAGEGQQLTLAQLEQVHRHKTGALIECAVEFGALAAPHVTSETLSALRRYAAAIGLAFQVQDDILDLIGDTTTLGKPQGSDLAHQKSTYPALLGLDGAQARLAQLHQDALTALHDLPYNSEILAEFADYIVNRQH